MCEWLKQFIADINNPVFVGFTTLVVALVALYVSWRSRVLAQQAFSLSLFNNRYKFYYEFRILIDELSSIAGFPSEKHLGKLKYLHWESKYIFGQEIEALLESLFRNTEIVFKNKEPVGIREDDELIEPMKEMKRLIDELSGKQPGATLDTYFQKYLYHEAFRQRI
jgi:hypothetical protein